MAPRRPAAPERELAERYGCSLITVRRALGDLAREHRLERARGRGTFVPRPADRRDLDGRCQLHRRDPALGLDPATRLVTARTVPADDPVAEALDIATRLADGPPRAAADGRRRAPPPRAGLPARGAFPRPAGHDLEHGSLYELLAERYDTRVVRAARRSSPSCCPAREAHLLGAAAAHAGAAASRACLRPGRRPVEFGRTYVRGDRTRYSWSGSSSAGPAQARRPARRPSWPVLTASDRLAAPAAAIEEEEHMTGPSRSPSCGGRCDRWRLRRHHGHPVTQRAGRGRPRSPPRPPRRRAARRRPGALPTVPPGGPVTIRGSAAWAAATTRASRRSRARAAFEATHPNIKVIDHTAYEGARDAFASSSPRATARRRRAAGHRRRHRVRGPVAGPAPYIERTGLT